MPRCGSTSRRGRRRLRRRHRDGAPRGAREPGVPLPHRARSQGVAPQTPYRVSDVELATRLSFFLWSSVPDDELLELAIAGRLNRPATLEQQVKRMLASPKADALVTNFAGQWLYLRNLAAASPDARTFPDFDDNLRQAFRRETELFVDSIMREDRSALDLLRANYTFVNERLAKHYGIPNVYGSSFRRVIARQRQRPRRDPRPGQRADGDVVRQPHVAGASRQMDPREHRRNAAASAAAERPAAQGHGRRGTRALDARPNGAASREPGLCRMPSVDGSRGTLDGELRRDRPMAPPHANQAAPSTPRAACLTVRPSTA